MSKPNQAYTPQEIQKIRQLAVRCKTWLDARDLIAKKLGVHPDNVTRLNRRHGIWGDRVKQPLPLQTEVVVNKPRKIRRLFVDIETSPNVVLSWRIGRDINLDYSNLLKERAIICICWKWAGESKVYSAQWDADQCDKGMLVEFNRALEEADEVIGHNIARFDFKWTKTRSLFHGLPPCADPKVTDTLRWARHHFNFNSNKLDYLAKYLGLGAKIKTEFNLWKEVVLNKNAQALGKMVVYCKNDVILLEKVWARLMEWAPANVHAGVLEGGEKWSCPKCGADDVACRSGVRVTAAGAMRRRMGCKSCGSSYTIGQAAYASYTEHRNLSRVKILAS